jgi:hypothetical protein
MNLSNQAESDAGAPDSSTCAVDLFPCLQAPSNNDSAWRIVQYHFLACDDVAFSAGTKHKIKGDERERLTHLLRVNTGCIKKTGKLRILEKQICL